MGTLVARKRKRRRKRLTRRSRLAVLQPLRGNPLMVPWRVDSSEGAIWEVREVHGDEDEEHVFLTLAGMGERDNAPSFALVADEWVVLGPPTSESHQFLLDALTHGLDAQGEPAAFKVQQSDNLSCALWLDQGDGSVMRIDCLSDGSWQTIQIERLVQGFLEDQAESDEHLMELENDQPTYQAALEEAHATIEEGEVGREWEEADFQENLIRLLEVLDSAGKIAGNVPVNFIPFEGTGESPQEIGIAEDFV